MWRDGARGGVMRTTSLDGRDTSARCQRRVNDAAVMPLPVREGEGDRLTACTWSSSPDSRPHPARSTNYRRGRTLRPFHVSSRRCRASSGWRWSTGAAAAAVHLRCWPAAITRLNQNGTPVTTHKIHYLQDYIIRLLLLLLLLILLLFFPLLHFHLHRPTSRFYAPPLPVSSYLRVNVFYIL